MKTIGCYEVHVASYVDMIKYKLLHRYKLHVSLYEINIKCFMF
jgi:hypothetical protein